MLCAGLEKVPPALKKAQKSAPGHKICQISQTCMKNTGSKNQISQMYVKKCPGQKCDAQNFQMCVKKCPGQKCIVKNVREKVPT